MKCVYTHENRFLVANARNIVEGAGIRTQMRNEFAAGAVGDIAPLETWPELWVEEGRDYQQAQALLDSWLKRPPQADWWCSHCGEANDPSFYSCWQCGRDRE